MFLSSQRTSFVMRYSFFSLLCSRREASGHADRISGTQQQFPEHPDSDPFVLDVPDTAGETTAQPGGAAQIVDELITCVVCHSVITSNYTSCVFHFVFLNSIRDAFEVMFVLGQVSTWMYFVSTNLLIKVNSIHGVGRFSNVVILMQT